VYYFCASRVRMRKKNRNGTSIYCKKKAWTSPNLSTNKIKKTLRTNYLTEMHKITLFFVIFKKIWYFYENIGIFVK
jgi:hypothetical protein